MRLIEKYLYYYFKENKVTVINKVLDKLECCVYNQNYKFKDIERLKKSHIYIFVINTLKHSWLIFDQRKTSLVILLWKRRTSSVLSFFGQILFLITYIRSLEILLVKKTTQLILLFHKKTTKLVFLNVKILIWSAITFTFTIIFLYLL